MENGGDVCGTCGARDLGLGRSKHSNSRRKSNRKRTLVLGLGSTPVIDSRRKQRAGNKPGLFFFPVRLPHAGASAARKELPLTVDTQRPPARPTLDTGSDLTWRSINTIRVLAMDAVEQAQSGHPGTPMALAPTAWLLWTRYLKHDPSLPSWPDRDRFVLSCGHASMLLYGLLHLTGYDLPLEEIKNFRQWGSKTPGHPEHGHTVGVETTTGPLGQGFANAVGMAIAERLLADRFNRPDHDVVDHRVWAFASDGDLMEGVASEAASLAGHLRLGKLTVIYDDNHITIDGDTALSFSEEVGRRFDAYGWRVLHVPDGNDLEAIDRALGMAAAESERPTLIVLRTIIGYPAPTRQNTAKAHGEALGKDEVARTKEILGWPADQTFHVPPEVGEAVVPLRSRLAERRIEWESRFAGYARADSDAAGRFADTMAGRISVDWQAVLPTFPAGTGLATRQASAKALEALYPLVPALAGGSADLAGSTGTIVKGVDTFGPEKIGRNFAWGIREHAMGSVMNGMALHGGVRPYGSTFLVFSDYMKPAIRLASLMGLPVIYIFTHDSIGLGEDGPTHQPIEHLAALRAVPNMTVIRPGDANETAVAWRAALTHTAGPTALILTRQKLPVPDRAGLGSADGVLRGGYILRDSATAPDAIAIATGSEVQLALEAAERLLAKGIAVRVVSLPSWEHFRRQPQSYRDLVLPPAVRARVSVEAGARMGWLEWTTEDGETIGIDHFGASAPGERLFEEFGFTTDAVVAALERTLARRR
jgi:transketolase